MAKFEIEIKDGVGKTNIPNGTYSVESDTAGYDNTTITPKQIEITSNEETYEFTLSVEGQLILHVTEEGTSEGRAIVGARFVRCDKNGDAYGTEIVTDSDGKAIFNNVPYHDSIKAPAIYYKQLSSDDFHKFDTELQLIVMQESIATIEVSNPLPDQKTIKLSEQVYSELPIEIGYIYLTKI